MKVQWGRVLGILLFLFVAAGVIVWTTPGILSGITLGLDLQGGFEVLYQLQPIEEGVEITQDTVSQTVAALERRINVIGVSEPNIFPEGTDRIRVQLAGVEDQDAARELLGTPARLTFRDMQNGEVLMTGADLREGGAGVAFDQLNRPVVTLKLKDGEKFAEITGTYAQKPQGENVIGIYLDEELLSAPAVHERITGGNAEITGMESVEEAQQLADLLNAGSLPVNLVELQAQSVGASLGQYSLEQTAFAGMAGGVVMLLFMIFYYRLPGLVASMSIFIYTYLLLLSFDFMGVTMTLSGIAAFVLTLGMAVDANILTAERIKEEIRSGKSVPSALRSGSRRALGTILDSNITTIIAAAVVFYFGSGAVRGFATTLILGIILSLLTNVWISRLLLTQTVRARIGRTPWYYGVKEEEISEL